MTSLLNKIVAGAPSRKSRFHDATGQRVSLSRAVRNGPRALASAVGRVAFGLRPERPWISYDAQRVLERHLGPHSAVLEYGSGMSTLWFARRVGTLVSVEDHAEWHRLVSERLPRGAATIDYRLATDRASYLKAPDGMKFDLVLVDGNYRDGCVEVGLELLRPGGILYLDNADHSRDATDGNVARGVALMHEAAARPGWRLESFTDFSPTNFFAQRALLLQRD